MGSTMGRSMTLKSVSGGEDRSGTTRSRVTTLDVFISHSSGQLPIAKRMSRSLGRLGLEVWIDDSDIRIGAILRDQLSGAIRDAKVFVLLWSKTAAKSRWVAAELLTAFHLDRPIVPCLSDKARLPQFLASVLSLDLTKQTRDWPRLLARGVRDARVVQPTAMAGQEPRLVEMVDDLGRKQNLEGIAFQERDLGRVRRIHKQIDRPLASARRRWRYDAQLLNIAGYHQKNAYMLKHWEKLQAGYTPHDALLQTAEALFFRSLFLNPSDPSALNGLASILLLEHELHAASFFNDRAIRLVEEVGGTYEAALTDRATIQFYLQRNRDR